MVVGKSADDDYTLGAEEKRPDTFFNKNLNTGKFDQ